MQQTPGVDNGMGIRQHDVQELIKTQRCIAAQGGCFHSSETNETRTASVN